MPRLNVAKSPEGIMFLVLRNFLAVIMSVMPEITVIVLLKWNLFKVNLKWNLK